MPLIETGGDASNRKPIESHALREELKEIGVILNLPAQRPKRATASMQAVVPSPFNVARLRSVAATVSLVVGAVICVFSLRKPPAPDVPDLLLGEWTTSNPRYEGRQLAFTETSIELGTAKDAARTRYPITSLSTKSRADTMIIALAYEDDGGTVELHARLIARDRTKLAFDRPYDLIWQRRTNEMPR